MKRLTVNIIRAYDNMLEACADENVAFSVA